MTIYANYVSSDGSLRRQLELRSQAGEPDHLNIGVYDANHVPTGINLSDADAVDLAVKILKKLDPDRLAPVPFVDLPVGTFLRRFADGKIAQVIATPAGSEDTELQDDVNWLAFDDGAAFIGVQETRKPAWEVIDPGHVDIITTTTWRYNQ